MRIPPLFDPGDGVLNMAGITLSPNRSTSRHSKSGVAWNNRFPVRSVYIVANRRCRHPKRHLVGRDLETTRTVLSLIQVFPPVVTVTFELRQSPIAASPPGGTRAANR
jgi:hypothetical protein